MNKDGSIITSKSATADLLDGRALASAICANVKGAALELYRKYRVLPTLAIIEVGNRNYGNLLQSFYMFDGSGVPTDPPLFESNYATLKARMAEKCAMRSQVVRFSESVTQERILATMKNLMDDPQIHGIVLELPLPPHLNENAILQALGPEKDAGGLSFHNLGQLCTSGGYTHALETWSHPSVPTAVIEILVHSDVQLSGKHAVVIGRSNTVGSPIAQLLLAHHCTVTVCHSQTQDLEDQVRRADVLVACAGRPNLVRGSWIKLGAVVIDVGMSVVADAKQGHTIAGDVCFDEAVEVASKITPVSRGVGHVSLAVLLRNVLNLARQAMNLAKIGIGPSHQVLQCADQLIFPDIGLKVPQVWLPRKDVDLTKWCVVACDQYTSQPEYWHSVSDLVGDSPSTLQLIFPEAFLQEKKKQYQQVIQGVENKMHEYIKDGILVKQHPGLILIDRKTPLVESRCGLLVSLDLELYSFATGSQTLIRATEKTISARLPPRVAIRKRSPLESPHILVLIDDPDRTVIEPLAKQCGTFDKVYDFELMKGSGHLKGWHIASRDAVDKVVQALRNLANPQRFRHRYEVGPEQQVLLFPVGDGNHSLATAKQCWEELKQKGADEATHPARYALVELVNIHDPGMTFEPIHRLVFNINVEAAMEDFVGTITAKGWGPAQILEGQVLNKCAAGKAHRIEFRSQKSRGVLLVENPQLILEVSTLMAWLDPYLASDEALSVDYVHGEEVIHSKTAEADTTLAFLLPSMDKHDLVKTVVQEGVLPRKTFSMGAADEKRFYLECTRIAPEPSFYKSDFFLRGIASVPLGGKL